MNKVLLLLLTVLLATLGRNIVHAQFTPLNALNPDSPVVVELFTSQSCSSCPSADKILSEISAHTNIIALGCHVTYWNHLHWVDDLSHEFCTQRQRDYAAFMNSRRVYTPQMIVNGRHEFTGSNRGALKKYVSSTPPIKHIRLNHAGNDVLNVQLPDIKNGRYSLTLFGVQTVQTRQIKSGENSGKTVAYSAPVTFIYEVESWDGTAINKTFTIPEKADEYVVLAQDTTTGEILAAGKL